MIRQTLVPCLRYHDARAAIDFLCRAFGFTQHAVYPDDDDPSIIHHAQLALGSNLIMLGSAHYDGDDPYGWTDPKRAGGITLCVCLVVDDPDAHHATAVAAGAQIVVPPHDNLGYPGRGYDARDPEGHIWSVSSYDPWG